MEPTAGRTAGPRRSPAPEERQIDAERSRHALLDAALEEFSRKGFAGARVRDIAERAGVNKDLIGYYFGGKDGLYAAVQHGWLQHEDAFSDPGLPLEELAARYLHDAVSDPRRLRLMVWRGLADSAEQPPDASSETEDLSSMRRRQERGELRADLDPATLRLALLGAISAPAVLPHMAHRIFGVAPDSPEFEQRYTDGLRRLLACLGSAPPDDDASAENTD